MKWLLSLKTWKAFLLVGAFPVTLIVLGDLVSGREHQVLEVTVGLIAGLTSLIWYFTVEREMTDLLNKRNITVRTDKWFLMIFVVCISLPGIANTESLPAWLMIVTGITSFITFTILLFRLSYKLRLLEEKEVKFGDVIKDNPALFGCLPIGIWFLQPRLRKIFEPLKSLDQ